MNGYAKHKLSLRKASLQNILIGADPCPDHWSIGNTCKHGHGHKGRTVRNAVGRCIECSRSWSIKSMLKRLGADHPDYISAAEAIRDKAEIKALASDEAYYDEIILED